MNKQYKVVIAQSGKIDVIIQSLLCALQHENKEPIIIPYSGDNGSYFLPKLITSSPVPDILLQKSQR